MTRRVPTQARARRKVDALLDAAAAVLAERGYAGASTGRIAAEAGCSVGSLYEYFEDKDALLAALLERESARSLRRVAAALGERDRPAAELVRDFVSALLAEGRAHPRLQRALLEETPPEPPFVGLGDAHERGLAALLDARLLGRPEAAGLRSAEDSRLAAAAADRLVRVQVARRPPSDDPDFVARAARLLGSFVQGSAAAPRGLGVGAGPAW